jgi:hypothetical protein
MGRPAAYGPAAPLRLLEGAAAESAASADDPFCRWPRAASWHLISPSSRVLSLPILLRPLPTAHPELATPVSQVLHRVITRHLFGQAGLKSDQADNGAVTLIQRFGQAAHIALVRRAAQTRVSQLE